MPNEILDLDFNRPITRSELVNVSIHNTEYYNTQYYNYNIHEVHLYNNAYS